jgi:hypothetical protein
MPRLRRAIIGSAFGLLTIAACSSFSADESPYPNADAGDGSTISTDDGPSADAPVDAGPPKSFFVIGGQTDVGSSKVTYVGALEPGGIVWREGPPLAVAVSAGCAATIDDRILLVGGTDPQGSILGAQSMRPSDPNAQWAPETAPIDPRQAHACVAAAGRLYVTGGGAPFSSVQKATTEIAVASVDGGLLWSNGPALPAAIQDHVSVAGFDWLYVLGGYPCRSQIHSASITGGGLGAWTDAGALRDTRYGAAAAALDDRIFVIGGLGGTACSTGSAAVDVLRVDPQGSVVSISGDRLIPDPRNNHRAAVVNGRLYVLGGNTGGGTPTPTRSVISAEIQADKSLGPWKEEERLPIALARFALVVR